MAFAPARGSNPTTSAPSSRSRLARASAGDRRTSSVSGLNESPRMATREPESSARRSAIRLHRSPLAQRYPVDVGLDRSEPIPRELGTQTLRCSLRPGPHAPSARERGQGHRQSTDVMRRDDAGAGRLEPLRDSTLIGHDDGEPRRRCLGRRDPEVLRGRREAEDICVREELGLLGTPRSRAGRRARGRSGRGRRGSGAPHPKPRRRSSGPAMAACIPDTPSIGGDQIGESLLPRDPAERHDEPRVLRDPMCFSERPASRQRQKLVDSDAVGSGPYLGSARSRPPPAHSPRAETWRSPRTHPRRSTDRARSHGPASSPRSGAAPGASPPAPARTARRRAAPSALQRSRADHGSRGCARCRRDERAALRGGRTAAPESRGIGTGSGAREHPRPDPHPTTRTSSPTPRRADASCPDLHGGPAEASVQARDRDQNAHALTI